MINKEPSFRDILELFVEDILGDIDEAKKPQFTRPEKEQETEKTHTDAQTAFKKMNDATLRRIMDDIRKAPVHPVYEKVYPTIVKEALISYEKTLKTERENCISSCTNELERVSAWIKEKIEEDRRYYTGDNPVYDPSEILDKVIDEMKRDAISKSTYYTDKINEINCILEGCTFEE